MMVLEGTDRELIEACRRGERDAFRALFERHRDKVYSVALRYSGDPSAAMDIAQDTFLKLFSSIRDYRGASSFDTWLYRLVVNSCLDRKRKLRRLLPLADKLIRDVPSPETNAIEDLLRSERDGHVRSAIAKLPPELRIVVVLRYTQGLSYDQIADALGCAAGTVASRLHRAHQLLQRYLAHLRNDDGGASA
jgi:RNA polymerase sigma-70 factor (ECF subfamily)